MECIQHQKKCNKYNRKLIVLAGGCFDLIHYGHVEFLKKAKSLGDYLIILLESDEKVRKLKGNSRPIHSQDQRREMLESLKFVDEVISLPMMENDREYFDLVAKIKPSVIAATQGDPIMAKKEEQVKMIGAKLVIIPKVHTPSTSQLVKLLGLE